MDGFYIKKTYGGVTKFEFRGKKMTKDEKISTLYVTGCFYKNGLPCTTFQADRAIFSEDGREMEASGNVRILDKENDTEIYLEDIKWDNAKRIYFTNKSVRQVSPDGQIKGSGLTASENLDRLEIKNPRVIVIR